MKRMYAKAWAAFALSLAVAAGGAGALIGAQSGVLTGENDVTSMIVSVVVPTNLDFTLDPLEINSVGGNQIAPANYFFVNRTGAPIKVTLSLKAELADGVDLVRTPQELAKDDDNVTDKRLFFGMLGADMLESGDLGFDNAEGHTAAGVYNPAGDTLIPFDYDTREAAITFALSPAGESSPGSGIDTLANGGMGVGAFQFYAELNTYANWGDGDLKVTGAYDITPLRTSTYQGYFSNGAFTDSGWNTQLKPPVPVENPVIAAEAAEDPALEDLVGN